MFNKDEYVNEIFKKYYEVQNKKTKKKHNIFSFKRFIQLATVGVLSLSVGVFAYTGVQNIISKPKIEQSSEIAEDRVEEYGMMPHAYNSGMEYYKIKTIDEYNDFKAVHKGLLKMTEKDFENSFLFVIWDKGEIEITNIDKTDTYLRIEVTRDAEKEHKLHTAEEPKVLSTKIESELDRENVVIDEYIRMTTLGDMKPLKDVLDYTPEELVQEGYVVLHNDGNVKDVLISKNQYKIDKFVEDLNNNKNAMIRVIEYNSWSYKFYDFKYIDGVLYEYYYFRWKNPKAINLEGRDTAVEYRAYENFRIVNEIAEEFLGLDPAYESAYYECFYSDNDTDRIFKVVVPVANIGKH